MILRTELRYFTAKDRQLAYQGHLTRLAAIASHPSTDIDNHTPRLLSEGWLRKKAAKERLGKLLATRRRHLTNEVLLRNIAAAYSRRPIYNHPALHEVSHARLLQFLGTRHKARVEVLRRRVHDNKRIYANLSRVRGVYSVAALEAAYKKHAVYVRTRSRYISDKPWQFLFRKINSKIVRERVRTKEQAERKKLSPGEKPFGEPPAIMSKKLRMTRPRSAVFLRDLVGEWREKERESKGEDVRWREEEWRKKSDPEEKELTRTAEITDERLLNILSQSFHQHHLHSPSLPRSASTSLLQDLDKNFEFHVVEAEDEKPSGTPQRIRQDLLTVGGEGKGGGDWDIYLNGGPESDRSAMIEESEKEEPVSAAPFDDDERAAPQHTQDDMAVSQSARQQRRWRSRSMPPRGRILEELVKEMNAEISTAEIVSEETMKTMKDRIRKKESEEKEQIREPDKPNDEESQAAAVDISGTRPTSAPWLHPTTFSDHRAQHHLAHSHAHPIVFRPASSPVHRRHPADAPSDSPLSSLLLTASHRLPRSSPARRTVVSAAVRTIEEDPLTAELRRDFRRLWGFNPDEMSQHEEEISAVASETRPQSSASLATTKKKLLSTASISAVSSRKSSHAQGEWDTDENEEKEAMAAAEQRGERVLSLLSSHSQQSLAPLSRPPSLPLLRGPPPNPAKNGAPFSSLLSLASSTSTEEHSPLSTLLNEEQNRHRRVVEPPPQPPPLLLPLSEDLLASSRQNSSRSPFPVTPLAGEVTDRPIFAMPPLPLHIIPHEERTARPPPMMPILPQVQPQPADASEPPPLTWPFNVQVPLLLTHPAPAHLGYLYPYLAQDASSSFVPVDHQSLLEAQENFQSADGSAVNLAPHWLQVLFINPNSGFLYRLALTSVPSHTHSNDVVGSTETDDANAEQTLVLEMVSHVQELQRIDEHDQDEVVAPRSMSMVASRADTPRWSGDSEQVETEPLHATPFAPNALPSETVDAGQAVCSQFQTTSPRSQSSSRKMGLNDLNRMDLRYHLDHIMHSQLSRPSSTSSTTSTTAAVHPLISAANSSLQLPVYLSTHELRSSLSEAALAERLHVSAKRAATAAKRRRRMSRERVAAAQRTRSHLHWDDDVDPRGRHAAEGWRFDRAAPNDDVTATAAAQSLASAGVSYSTSDALYEKRVQHRAALAEGSVQRRRGRDSAGLLPALRREEGFAMQTQTSQMRTRQRKEQKQPQTRMEEKGAPKFHGVPVWALKDNLRPRVSVPVFAQERRHMRKGGYSASVANLPNARGGRVTKSSPAPASVVGMGLNQSRSASLSALHQNAQVPFKIPAHNVFIF